MCKASGGGRGKKCAGRRVCACAAVSARQGRSEAVLTAREAARVPGMPLGGGVGSNEFE